jgi:NADP-dependent aldehyde dehydrogenase
MTAVISIDPRNGSSVELAAETTSEDQLSDTVSSACEAFTYFQGSPRSVRSDLLEAWADALESRREDIVAIADRETALGSTRLNGELTRTAFQLRFFAGVVDEGSYLEATIDHAGDTPMGPRPDLRRLLVPLGPVAVFGASNFPLAFSVAGGDTASAIAAGCPVVVKVHDSHPGTSLLVAHILREAAARVGAPRDVLSLVFGFEAGKALVVDPRIQAVGFTGSFGGGKALLDLVNSRPQPIPFYGELSGLNPLVVLPGAVNDKADAIAAGLAGSFTASGGQFCTKPGLAFVPSGPAGDDLVAQLSSAVVDGPSFVLLNSGIAASYGRGRDGLAGQPAVSVEAEGKEPDENEVRSVVLQVSTSDLEASHLEEVFGPLVLVVRYDGSDDLLAALRDLPASLTGTVHMGAGDDVQAAQVATALQDISGRVLFNGYPTGVAVAWSQHHGGPWPSTNTLHTSVGASAIRRFLRPVAWQDAPESLLPEELRDSTTGLVRRVDGSLVGLA